MNKIHTQRGNVIFYILIAVALLAALSFTVTQTMRGGTDSLGSERARLYAAELIEYGNIVSSAVAQLRLRGCSEARLDFYHSTVTGYVNAASPSDNSCDIFHINGGGVERISIPADITDSAASPDYIWGIFSANEIQDIGQTDSDDDSADLILVADSLKLDVCIKINDLLGVTNPSAAPPTDTNIEKTPFTGSFSYANSIGDEASALEIKSAACFRHTTSDRYAFYKVLIAR